MSGSMRLQVVFVVYSRKRRPLKAHHHIGMDPTMTLDDDLVVLQHKFLRAAAQPLFSLPRPPPPHLCIMDGAGGGAAVQATTAHFVLHQPHRDGGPAPQQAWLIHSLVTLGAAGVHMLAQTVLLQQAMASWSASREQ
jgi:hypothetical protein